MRERNAVLLLAVASLMQPPLWVYLVNLVLRTRYLSDPISVPLKVIAVCFTASIAAAIIGFTVGRECWARRRWASAILGLSMLNFFSYFCLTFFGYVWEYRAGKPFGLLEVIKSWF